MSHAAANGNQLSTGSECIFDAQAFTVGHVSKKVHAVKSFPDSVRVVAKCGAVGYADYFGTAPEGFPDGTGFQHYGTRPAQWADSDITCPTCRKK